MHQLHNRLLLFLFQSAPVVLLFLPTLEVAAAEQAQIAFVSNSSSSGTTLTHDASDGLSATHLHIPTAMELKCPLACGTQWH